MQTGLIIVGDEILSGKRQDKHLAKVIELLAARGLALSWAQPVPTVPGMPPVPDPRNVYSETAAGKFAPAVAGARERIYVPNLRSNDVYVVDPVAMKPTWVKLAPSTMCTPSACMSAT